MTGKWMRLLAVVAVGGLVLAACSSSGSSKSSSTTKKETTTTKAAPSKPTMAATNTSNLNAPATCTEDATATCPVVKVTGKGFTPGKHLGVTECADKGDQTGAGDCFLGGISQGTAGSDGTVAIDQPVTKAFGQNKITCGGTTKCLVSLGELSADPKAERADNTVPITFAG